MFETVSKKLNFGKHLMSTSVARCAQLDVHENLRQWRVALKRNGKTDVDVHELTSVARCAHKRNGKTDVCSGKFPLGYNESHKSKDSQVRMAR